MDFTALDYSTVRKKILDKKLSCKELTEQYLKNIDKGAHLNAFISVLAENALKQADALDAKISKGNAGALAGLVLGVKDLIVIKDELATCGSKILSNFKSLYNATVIDNLLSQDVNVIGKLNMDEFAMGSSNENSYFGPVKNPHDNERVPGGSSGGSAAAVAANLCVAALGSDTGGSIRQPASFCGVVGLKPTYGRVSRFGLVAYASSLDQIGPLSKSVSDSALLLNYLGGYDEKDSTSAKIKLPDFTRFIGKDVKSLKIGLPKEYFAEGLNKQVSEAIHKTAKMLEGAGAELVEVQLPNTEYAIASYYIIATAEASANLARFDGVRYGYRSENANNLEDMYVNSRTEGFGDEVKRRIMLGTYVLSSGYYDAYYKKAQQVRTLLRQDFSNAFEQVDCLLTPTAPTTAFKIGENANDPLTMYLQDVYTVSLNLAGLPGISVPCGKDSDGLPIGAQLIGKAFDEGTILQVADFVEKNLDQGVN